MHLLGRLTKKCWSEVPVYPPSFRSFKFAYSETSTTHHSWTFDHLQSVISLLEKAENLETISITRIVPHAAQLPFQHDKIDMAAQMMPKPLPDGLLPALFRHKQSLRALELDFWECSFERTKAILETCLNLQKLSVIFDAPFAKLVSLLLAVCKAYRRLSAISPCPAYYDFDLPDYYQATTHQGTCASQAHTRFKRHKHYNGALYRRRCRFQHSLLTNRG